MVDRQVGRYAEEIGMRLAVAQCVSAGDRKLGRCGFNADLKRSGGVGEEGPSRSVTRKS